MLEYLQNLLMGKKHYKPVGDESPSLKRRKRPWRKGIVSEDPDVPRDPWAPPRKKRR